MTKKTFIKNLKQRLNVLDESEIEDIVSEYTDIIDEKIKNGQSEKEAIADFGDFDELVKEILKAYKINPNYGEKEDEKEFGESVESWIKTSSTKLADFFKKTVASIQEKDNEFTVETVFEIIIKALLFLVILAIIRLPFILIENLGEVVLHSLPIFHIFDWVWILFVWILYVVICVLIGIAMFKNYNFSQENRPKNKKKKVKWFQIQKKKVKWFQIQKKKKKLLKRKKKRK